MRFDFNEDPSGLPNAKSRSVRSFKRKIASTSDYLLHWHEKAGGASIDLPNAKLTAGFNPIFDPRTIAMTTLFEQSLGAGDLSMPMFVSMYRSFEFEQAEEGKDGLFVLRAPFDEINYYSLWLDIEKGYLPVRYERSHTARHDLVTNESQTTWKLIGDTWVPETCRITRRRLQPVPPAVVKPVVFSIAFAWESVNEPVSPADFTWEGLGLPLGTYVYDARLGKMNAIRVGRVGDKPPITRIVPTSRNNLRIKIALGTSVIGLLVAFFVFMRHRQRGSL